MGAYIKNINVKYQDKSPVTTFTVRYSDNGYSDSIQKTFQTIQDAKDWLQMWYGDTSGGFEQLKYAEKCLLNR